MRLRCTGGFSDTLRSWWRVRRGRGRQRRGRQVAAPAVAARGSRGVRHRRQRRLAHRLRAERRPQLLVLRPLLRIQGHACGIAARGLQKCPADPQMAKVEPSV